MPISAENKIPFSRSELAAEAIAVKIRWFGLIIAFVLVNASTNHWNNRLILNIILIPGVLYALIDSIYSLRGRVFLQRAPLLISFMEAVFIGLLCYFHAGLDSPFRYYYLLSLICCAMRHPSRVTLITCGMHCTSYSVLFLLSSMTQDDLLTWLLIIILMIWVTWACDALSYLLKRVGHQLRKMNDTLLENQAQLEARIQERTSQLQEAQALLLHQEKMAAFGLLAAGIAHEVGNPLTAISSLVQILQKRQLDDNTQDKLSLVNGELKRIQTTLRELIDFSRPAKSDDRLVSIREAVSEALNIAKYHKRTKQRKVRTNIHPGLPVILGKREMLVQIILNLVLNAVDATEPAGNIDIDIRMDGQSLVLEVSDDGHGISEKNRRRIFQPYFTTKSNGTGLGLFVTEKLVADHGGTVTCASSGDGTTFTVTLPFHTVGRNRNVLLGADLDGQQVSNTRTLDSLVHQEVG